MTYLIDNLSESFYKQIENTYNERMSNHRNLVDTFYYKITGKHCYQHDMDKDNNPIWKFYYYCRENKLDLPTQLKYEWMFADKLHRLNSSHHIECLTNNIELDWDELVADFFAVNHKHNIKKEQMLENIKNYYYYAYDEILVRIQYYNI